ncbi:sensor histidine kinase [Pseudoalteromonas rubra]|uniref:histidine kinase n=1 Tax=Pseudoalteromonas rubra TaxID=43658 RepID=A0A5S3WX23_9GAMM|nr:ATP-binding protein [Pseudoalteromonas rubra]TMP35033.1 hypothetical protein CWB98_17095 [Pseudoalteromonas rubra]
MQVNTLRVFAFIAVAIVLNSVVAFTVRNTLLIDIETQYIETQNQFLDDVKAQISAALTDPERLPLSGIQMQLEAQYDTSALLVARDDEYFPQDLLAELALPHNQHGLVDYLNATVYFALNDKDVLEVGPLVEQNMFYFLVDWFDWLISACLNLLLLMIFWLVVNKERQALVARLNTMPVPLTQPQDLNTSLQQLSQLVDAQLSEGEARITLQRDLLHGVAHEFRSPMARMQFALDMLEEAGEDEREELHASLSQSLKDLDSLVSELLYYARVKDNSVKPNLTTLNINTLLQDTLDKVVPFYPHIGFELDSADIHWHGDDAQVKRLFTNLMRNAGRFARTRVRVAACMQGSEVVVRVADDGIGIPPGKQTRIFEPFTRLDPSRSRDSGGCGLGLAIVQSIAIKHHGTVRVSDENAELGGACFEVRLPIMNESHGQITPGH